MNRPYQGEPESAWIVDPLDNSYMDLENVEAGRVPDKNYHLHIAAVHLREGRAEVNRMLAEVTMELQVGMWWMAKTTNHGMGTAASYQAVRMQWLERELYELRSRVQQQEQLVPPTVQLGHAAAVQQDGRPCDHEHEGE